MASLLNWLGAFPLILMHGGIEALVYPQNVVGAYQTGIIEIFCYNWLCMFFLLVAFFVGAHPLCTLKYHMLFWMINNHKIVHHVIFRSLSRSPSRVSTFGSKRWENRGRTREGLIIHDRDFPDCKGGSKRANWDGMTAVQTTRRSGITNKEIKGLVPALDQSDDLGRSISPGLESWRRHTYNINPKHGCSRSERYLILQMVLVQ